MAKALPGPLPATAALLSGAAKARPGRRAATGPIVKSLSGVKTAPARPSGVMGPAAMLGGKPSFPLG